MNDPLRILIVDDSTTDAKIIVHELRRAGHDIHFEQIEDEAAMRDALARSPWDLIVSDWTMPHFSALDALATLKDTELDIPLVIVSGTISDDIAVDAMRAGARDFLHKDRLARLAPAVEREIRERKLREARRGSEEQLRHAQKLEGIGRLAAGVAHDFNNLLSVVLSYSELALSDLPEGHELHDDLLEIKHAGERAATLTRQLLAFSRQQVLQPRIVDLNEIVAGMEKMLRRLLREDVELSLRLPPALPKIRVDPGQIEQVVLNLAVNAHDAMPSGGKLTIETAAFAIDAEQAAAHAGLEPGLQVMLAMTDTGVGMDEETQSRIFEPFFTTKNTGEGTGIGLATVQGIVHQSGGTISVDSKPGGGTTFKLYLPVADRPERSLASMPTETVLQGGSETILLVEDDPSLRTLARAILVKQGYNVLDAQSGGDALLICEQHADPIDLLLTDVVMPRMSGRQLAERLRPLRPSMAVLYMSGYTDDAVVRRGVLESEVSFVQKPITPAALSRAVREVLDAATRG